MFGFVVIWIWPAQKLWEFPSHFFFLHASLKHDERHIRLDYVLMHMYDQKTIQFYVFIANLL